MDVGFAVWGQNKELRGIGLFVGIPACTTADIEE